MCTTDVSTINIIPSADLACDCTEYPYWGAPAPALTPGGRFAPCASGQQEEVHEHTRRFGPISATATLTLGADVLSSFHGVRQLAHVLAASEMVTPGGTSQASHEEAGRPTSWAAFSQDKAGSGASHWGALSPDHNRLAD